MGQTKEEFWEIICRIYAILAIFSVILQDLRIQRYECAYSFRHRRQFKDFDLLWEGFSTPILRDFPLKSGLKTPPTRETPTLFS